ncbi:hypothetical protein TNCT_350541 [Trichonephila clavata]|uniref:Secreted protein n=1 Tax=Trichonephila clavata TaxID=2740835 RepID=A0A8X6G5M2_TRICU|nr:hypothetical protein TNCT_350541 [Trichonephila clavata]
MFTLMPRKARRLFIVLHYLLTATAGVVGNALPCEDSKPFAVWKEKQRRRSGYRPRSRSRQLSDLPLDTNTCSDARVFHGSALVGIRVFESMKYYSLK